MKEFQFVFEPYINRKSRHTCPFCKRKGVFTRYIDKATGSHLPEKYGRCNREEKCGYYLNPYTDGYHRGIASKGKGVTWTPKVSNSSSKRIIPLPESLIERSQKDYHNNNFVKYLNSLFGEAFTEELIQRFNIGTSKHWERKGATVFWITDTKNRPLGAQVVLFDDKGHTQKEEQPNGELIRCTNWVHVLLKITYKEKNQPIPDWLKTYSEDALKFPCLFGLSQLNETNRDKPLAIVEAPKTAIIASAFFPQFIWLAVGGLGYLNESRLQDVKGRKIVLYPDRGGYEKWKSKAASLSHLARIEVSDLLERKQAFQGADIADYLCKYGIQDLQTEKEEAKKQEPAIKQNPTLSRIEKQKIILQQMENKNPNLTKLINHFQLKIC